MVQHKGYERMHELIASLQQALLRLEQGQLGSAELEQCTEDARALYERLIVLRHKAREMDITTPVTEPPQVKEPVLVEKEREPIRLDTRPPDLFVHQTSLIDAIAETETGRKIEVPESAPAVKVAPIKVRAEKVARVADQPPKERPVTVADKMEHAPVADLHKAIALSQKFWFISELFGGQRELYEGTIDGINGMATFEEAETHMRQEVLAKLNKPPGEDVLATFMELLHRRFR